MQTHAETRLLSTHEAAAYLGVGISTLERYRCLGGGPQFMRTGRRLIRYRKCDLDAWLRPQHSTSEGTRDLSVV